MSYREQYFDNAHSAHGLHGPAISYYRQAAVYPCPPGYGYSLPMPMSSFSPTPMPAQMHQHQHQHAQVPAPLSSPYDGETCSPYLGMTSQPYLSPPLSDTFEPPTASPAIIFGAQIKEFAPAITPDEDFPLVPALTPHFHSLVSPPTQLAAPIQIKAPVFEYREPPEPTLSMPALVLPLKKRSRTAQACEKCRVRKAKCSGEQPCGRCTTKKLDCVFAGSSRRLPRPPMPCHSHSGPVDSVRSRTPPSRPKMRTMSSESVLRTPPMPNEAVIRNDPGLSALGLSFTPPMQYHSTSISWCTSDDYLASMQPSASPSLYPYTPESPALNMLPWETSMEWTYSH